MGNLCMKSLCGNEFHTSKRKKDLIGVSTGGGSLYRGRDVSTGLLLDESPKVREIVEAQFSISSALNQREKTQSVSGISEIMKMHNDCKSGSYSEKNDYGESGLVRLLRDCRNGQYKGVGAYGTSPEVRCWEDARARKFRSGSYGLTPHQERIVTKARRPITGGGW